MFGTRPVAKRRCVPATASDPDVHPATTSSPRIETGRALGARAHGDPLALEDLAQHVRHIVVLARSDPGTALENRHLAA